MAKIKIHRSSEYTNKLRNINLWLDSQKIGEIRDGESIEFEVSPGKHTLIARIDWTSSNPIEFTIDSEQLIHFNLSGRNPFLALLYITIWRNKYLKLIILD